MKYDKNKYTSLLSALTQIKYLPEEKVLRSLIDTSIKEGDFSDAYIFVTHHCTNSSSQIKGIDFDHSYSTVAHADYCRINITITALHRLNVIILDVSNEFYNTNFTIHERFFSFHHPII